MDAALNQNLNIAQFQLNVWEDRLYQDGVIVPLEPQAFAILLHLVQNHQRIVTKNELLETFWQGKIVTEASISNEIKQIRKALGDSGRTQKFVRTIHGKGFQFMVAPIEAADNNNLKPSQSDNPTYNMHGRTDEIKEVSSLLIQRPASIVTLLGPGGIGKTTVAKALANTLADHFTDGISFIDLLPANNTQTVLEQIIHKLDLSHALKFGEQPVKNIADKLGALLSSKKQLLILDNFEHVIDAAEVISDLQKQAGLAILVTSREMLCVSNEVTFNLDGLSCQSIDDAVSDACLLFLERSAKYASISNARKPPYQKINLICQKLGGMPLAIELAVGWLRYLSLDDLSAEIDRSLNWLETDIRDIPERHRSTLAIFEYSWQRLNEGERHGLARMALFPLGFSRSMSKAFGQLSIMQLASLERAGLVKLGDGGIYSLHELIRQLAKEKLKQQRIYEQTQQDYATYLFLYCRYYVHIIRRTSEQTNNSYSTLKLLVQSFELLAPWYIKHNNFTAIQIFFVLGFNSKQPSRTKSRIFTRYLPILKPHVPFNFYVSASIEVLFSQIWQHHADLDVPIQQAFTLFHELEGRPSVYRARIATIISQIYRVNERFDESRLWANRGLKFFAEGQHDNDDLGGSPISDSICQAWCYTTINDFERALKFIDIAIAESLRRSPHEIWVGGYSSKAWILAHLQCGQESHRYSWFLFNESLIGNETDFPSIWTLQAAQICEYLKDIDHATDFLAFSEYYLHHFQSQDLSESLHTQEVLSFLARMRSTLGDDAYNIAVTRWIGQSIEQVNLAASETFKQLCESDVPTLQDFNTAI